MSYIKRKKIFLAVSMFLPIIFSGIILASLSRPEHASAIDPMGLTTMANDERSISLSSSNDDVQFELHATEDGVFESANTTLTVSTSNPTGYTLWATTSGKDHTGELTSALVHKNPRVQDSIKSIEERTTVTDFPMNSWGVGVSNSPEELTTFLPISTDYLAIHSTDAAKEADQANVVIGVKADRELPSGEYSNLLEFTAVSNPVPYTFTLNYSANGGSDAPETESKTVFDQNNLEFTVSSQVPVRRDHATGSYSFLGWSEDPTATTANIFAGDVLSLVAEGDETRAARNLYAVWQKNYNYELRFNAGATSSATNLPAPKTATSTGEARFTVPSTIPQRSGYIFMGYSDGSSTIYEPGGTYTVPASDSGSNPIIKTLTAQWGSPSTSSFGATGSIQTYTAANSGYYRLEVWGTSGGKSNHGVAGGSGGYSYGTYKATKGTVFYVVVGTAGGAEQGGYNGGGNGSTINSDSAAGGGATHIALATGLLSSLRSNPNAVLIVAGSGGGAGCSDTYGGGGGGTTGTPAVDSHTEFGGAGGPGTQTSGGAGGANSGAGSFGQGGHTGLSQAWPGGGGGGGYYGGGAGGNMPGGGGAGGGGSGFVSPLLSSAYTYNANQNFSSPYGGTETGHTGNGYARITYLGYSI